MNTPLPALLIDSPSEDSPASEPLPVEETGSAPGPKTRRRGGQPGNKNAFKHGFYTANFKKADQKAFDGWQFSGLAEEIALLRVYIRRVVELGVSVDHLPQSIDLLRALSLAVTSLNRLVKTQAFIANGDDEISIAIRDVLNELTKNVSPIRAPVRHTIPEVENHIEDDDLLDQGFIHSLYPDPTDLGE